MVFCVVGMLKPEVETVMEDRLVTVIPVFGMTCQNCVNKTESAVAKFPSVVLVKVIVFTKLYFLS